MRNNIEAERARIRMTKEELANVLGISQKTYGNYIDSKTSIPSSVLLKMANLFDVSTDYLLEETERVFVASEQ